MLDGFYSIRIEVHNKSLIWWCNQQSRVSKSTTRQYYVLFECWWYKTSKIQSILSSYTFVKLWVHSILAPTFQLETVLEKLSEWDEKLKSFLEMVPEHSRFDKRQIRTVVNGIYNVCQAIHHFDEKSLGKLNAKMSLIRSSEKILPFPDDFREQEVKN